MLGQSQVVGDVGELLRLPLLHVEDDEGGRPVTEDPVGELPQPVTPGQGGHGEHLCVK